MKPYQAVLYIKKNLPHRSITTSKYIKIRQPRPEIEGVSKITLTVRHPVYGPDLPRAAGRQTVPGEVQRKEYISRIQKTENCYYNLSGIL